MPPAHQASSAAMAVPLEALSPAEPWRPSTGPRIWFAIAALVVYRLGTYIPLPGIDPSVLAQIFRTQSGGDLGMLNMFAGRRQGSCRGSRSASCARAGRLYFAGDKVIVGHQVEALTAAGAEMIFHGASSAFVTASISIGACRLTGKSNKIISLGQS